jgi:hypothetical protein
MQNVLHVRGQLVHYCKEAEHTGPVCDDDGPHARSRQDADPRHAMSLPSDTQRWYNSYTAFLTSSTLFPDSSLIVIALTYRGPTPTYWLSCGFHLHLPLHVNLTSPRGLPLYLEGASNILLKVNVYHAIRATTNGVPRGGFGGSTPPPRNSKVLTKLSRIPSSVEITSLTT